MSFETLVQQVLNNSPESDPQFLRSAYVYAQELLQGQKLGSGMPYIEHALGTAMILARLQMGPETVAAALLHDVPLRTAAKKGELQKRFGEETVRLVESSVRLSRISWGKLEKEKAAALRKLFVAMVDDVRVVLIRLAEQVNFMCSISAFPSADQEGMAHESLDIFAPLADRLGISSLRRELEDLAWAHLFPDKFKEITRYLAQRGETREQTIRSIIEALTDSMDKAGIVSEISGRPKHVFSIYKKMQSTQRDISRIYDVQALRIIVGDVKDCYASLDLVHGLWPPIPGEFDDYIAKPKSNMYQSLHTAVVGPGEQALEIQIRTKAMHRTAELGIAAHWRYKESAKNDISQDAKVVYLRGLLSWQKDLFPQHPVQGREGAEPLVKNVFVLTPMGDVLALPLGATPLDFAYRVHTSVGHRCRGAKVNGKMASLDTRLRHGDRVEILTGKKETPSRDWLNPRRGFIHSQRARRDIRTWFINQERKEFIDRGKALVDRTLKRLGERIRDYENIADRFAFSKPEDFLEAVGRGILSSEFIKNRLAKPVADQSPTLPLTEAGPISKAGHGVSVKGMDDLLTRTAHCCNPLPGDRIMGYITRGRGITIHRQDCYNILKHPDRDRIVEVSWGDTSQDYVVSIQVVGSDSQKLLREAARIVEEEKARLLGTKVTVSPVDRLQTLHASLEIRSVVQMQKILQRLKGLASVIEARRIL